MKIMGYDMPFTKVFAKADEKERQPGTIELEKDGSYDSVSRGAGQYYVDPTNFVDTTEAELIDSYRRISLFPEVDWAIADIINAVLVFEEDKNTVDLLTDHLVEDKLITKGIADKLVECHEEIIDLLDFESKGYDIFRDWYVDSRICYVKNFSKNPKNGISSLTQLDPRKLRKVRIVEEQDSEYNVVEEFWVYLRSSEVRSSSNMLNVTKSVYDGTISSNVAFKMPLEKVSSITSGLIDKNSNITYGFLHKSIRVANQLDLVESSLIVHRLSRSHDVRAIYVSTGNLSPAKSQQKIDQVARKMKREVGFDTVRGQLTSRNRVMAMGEDLFFGRTGDQKSTEVENLSQGPDLGNLDDVEMFRNKLYMALDVPVSRFTDSTSLFSQESQITRDELKFHRFISRVRSKFSKLFVDLLETHVVAKKVMTISEFREIRRKIRYTYNRDNFYTELKDLELMSMRLNAASEAEPYVGKYISHNTVRKEVLYQSEEDIERIDKQIAEEKKDPRYKNLEEENY